MLRARHCDNSIRWRPGERLDHLFERCCDQFSQARGQSLLAVDCAETKLTFQQLDAQANQLARFLKMRGVQSGDRVGLLFDRTPKAYIAMLAVLKLNAAYVPLDLSFPPERLGFILKDAVARVVITSSADAAPLAGLPVATISVDDCAAEIERQQPIRLSGDERQPPCDELCYIIYTSGTTGQPKGVAVDHASICNFVRVAAEVYGYRPGDRVYQGMTIAFDFSVEELWVPLLSGATLVTARPGGNLVGGELADYLAANRVTALCCVPTLLATIEQDLPDLRLLLVSGEACPQNLVERWHRPTRQLLNVYGPTEATVTATLKELKPGEPVTIGAPLPTYTIVILDEAGTAELANGAAGEIGIAGVGLARGYLNRDALTAEKFIADVIGVPDNPSHRIYRTGDLGRINERGEVEYLGRIDTQVKIRGYRIELTEIESLLMQMPEIAQAVVQPVESEPGLKELVAYYSTKSSNTNLAAPEIAKRLRGQLPAYMVPAYYECLALIPMSASHKADRKALPAPKSSRVILASATDYAAPETPAERELARVFEEVTKVASPSVEANFFADLGGHSLLMARYCAALRRNPQFAQLSIRDIYLNPTIRKLAESQATAATSPTAIPAIGPAYIPSVASYWTCGMLQAAFYVGIGWFDWWLICTAWTFISTGANDTLSVYAKSVVAVTGAALTLTALPVAAKWLLLGRLEAGSIPIWSIAYFRFWVVRTLVQNAPPVLLVGTPIYNAYLRLLGTQIGPNAVVLSRVVPVGCDLISIGADAVLTEEALVLGYKAQGNRIHFAPIRIGERCIVGHRSVIDIDTSLPNDAELAPASSLLQGQHLKPGSNFHGSPAQATKVSYCPIERRPASIGRAWTYNLCQLVYLIGIVAPAAVMASLYADALLPSFLIRGTSSESAAAALTYEAGWTILTACLTYLGGLSMLLVLAVISSRLLAAAITPGVLYPVFGLHYAILQVLRSLSNPPMLGWIFGDSAFITSYLQWIGCQLRPLVQTGSNFGVFQQFDVPAFCKVSSGTMVSDGLMMANAHVTSGTFTVRQAQIAERNYLGNMIDFPPESRVGENCLLATKVLVPVDGPLRTNVGLLGSPAFEIPRAVVRDVTARADRSGDLFPHLVRLKTRHNLVTLAYFMAWELAQYSALALVALEVLGHETDPGPAELLVLTGLEVAIFVMALALRERSSLGFRSLRPMAVTIYDPMFWAHERYWKLTGSALIYFFRGTPFRSLVLRLVGMRVGKMVFDDGAGYSEASLVEVGDYANLNFGAQMHGHSLEEGVFKSDRIAIGPRCALGPGAFVHYGVTVGSDAIVAPDSFVMKGECPESGTIWCGNPARVVAQGAGHAMPFVAT